MDSTIILLSIMFENKKQNSLNLRTIIISSLVVFIFLTAVFTVFIFFLAIYYPQEQNILLQITIIAYDTPTILAEDNDIFLSATATANVVLHKFSNSLKVKIHGTGGDGLRIHQEPGENSPTIYLAAEGDFFTIEEGPTLLGGYVWWKIKSLLDEKTSGWAAEDFLQIAISTS
jgi:hypothetical protein